MGNRQSSFRIVVVLRRWLNVRYVVGCRNVRTVMSRLRYTKALTCLLAIIVVTLIRFLRNARMDLDTTRTRNAYERLIADFSEGRTNLLIGTQMVSKGLDFDKVSVVGILNADSMLNYPDFRAYEHAFMMMAQVSGRAGRKGKRGLVILQTKNPTLPVIGQVVNNDYEGLYQGIRE